MGLCFDVAPARVHWFLRGEYGDLKSGGAAGWNRHMPRGIGNVVASPIDPASLILGDERTTFPDSVFQRMARGSNFQIDRRPWLECHGAALGAGRDLGRAIGAEDRQTIRFSRWRET